MTEWKQGDSEADPRNRKVLHTASGPVKGSAKRTSERSERVLPLDGDALCATRPRSPMRRD